MKKDDLDLTLSGNTLDEIWDDLVRQIAISSETLLHRPNQTIDEQLKEQDEIDRLNKLIKKRKEPHGRNNSPRSDLNYIQSYRVTKTNWRK